LLANFRQSGSGIKKELQVPVIRNQISILKHNLVVHNFGGALTGRRQKPRMLPIAASGLRQKLMALE
jgi:hypothetical protein